VVFVLCTYYWLSGLSITVDSRLIALEFFENQKSTVKIALRHKISVIDKIN
jgi:hypothetical protein